MSDPTYPPYQQPPGGQPAGQPGYGSQPSSGSPYGQPPYGQQPPHEQPPYGQPDYGQPSHEQPPYGQPGQSQPSYGQPTYGQPSYGQPSYGQPEYGQPTYGQPAYGQPTYGQPEYGQPAYGQPEYGQPNYGQPTEVQSYPPGPYDQPAYRTADFGGPGPYGQPPRKSRTALWISLGVVVVLVVAAAGVGALYAATRGNGGKPSTAGQTAQPSASADPYAAERDASLTAPKTLAGLTKSTDKDLQKTATDLTKQMKGSVPGARDSIAAFYEDPNDQGKLVMVAGVTSNLPDPAAELDGTFRGLGTGGLPVSKIKKTDAGPLGGEAKCGTATAAGIPVAVCAWADHGSVGMTFFYNRTVNQSTALFLKIRKAVLKRK